MAMMMKKDPHQVICLLQAFGRVGDRASLLGVVVEFGAPRKSRGTDYVCTLKIVDETYQTPVAVNFFAPSIVELPRVNAPGDLIHVSNVKIEQHEHEVTAVFQKRQSSFAIFDGTSNGAPLCNLYQSSSNYSPAYRALEIIGRLRNWFREFQLDVGINEYLSSLNEIKEGLAFDLVCKVLLVHEVCGLVYLLVWDGTDTPPLSFSSKLEDEAKTSLNLESPALPRNTLCTLPTIGSTLSVLVDSMCVDLLLRLLRSDQWVMLRNITCRISSSFWRGDFMPNSKIRCLADEDSIVKQRLRSFDERNASKAGRVPLSSSLSMLLHTPFTETIYVEPPLSTLMDVLTYSEVTKVFICIVRVVALYPWRLVDFRSQQQYAMKFILEDPTGRVHAFLFHKDAVKFFGKSASAEVFSRARHQLLGISADADYNNDEAVNVAPRNPPWVHICLKSYYTGKEDTWGTRKFMISNTRFRYSRT